MALAHYGFGEAAHQEVHQTGAAVCAEYQQVGAVFIGVIDQILRHFARAFVGYQQVFDNVFHAVFAGGFFSEVQDFVAWATAAAS